MLRKMSARLTVAWLAILLSIFQVAYAQKTVTGTVTDQDGKGIPGVTVTVKGTSTATQTDQSGNFSIAASDNATLVFSSVGFTSTEVAVSGRSTISTTLAAQNQSLSEVVVIGYGTARRRDVTGSVASVNAKDFNKGVQVAADQLIQGKVAGVQVMNNSGAPGGGTTIRIRGASSIRAGNQPLFVVDGVPLDNNSARPGGGDVGLGDRSPGTNPLNFINPNDIASIDVLKDASATAIYGSRGANGVVLITTKKGQSGAPKIEFNASAGLSNVMKRLEVLSGDEYRAGLRQYNLGTANDFKGNVDAFDEITQTGFVQNYSAAVGAGNENGRYRLSLGYLDQEGVIRKSDIRRYTANFNGGFRFLESKRLGLDINILTTQTLDNAAPISNNAGYTGSLIGQALQWNPTRPLRKADGSLDIDKGGDVYNPLAVSEAYNDMSKVTTVLASISPSFKITNNLEYKLLASVNYATGDRKIWVANFVNLPRIQRQLDQNGNVTQEGGFARIGNNEAVSQQITNTLSFTKDFSDAFNLNAVVGTEYLKYNNRNNNLQARNFPNLPYPYYDFFQSTDPTRIEHGFYVAPTTELQSYFGRTTVNLNDKYLLTATFRADGSSKFGKNNRYGYFPSFAAAWNISNEDFYQGTLKDVASNLKLRLGWGRTGNQEFPAGASQRRFGVGFGSINREQLENPDLKWETSTTTNAGLDFAIFGTKVNGSVDWFRKSTEDILFLRDAPDPVIGGGRRWVNLPGRILNSGVELSLNTTLMRNRTFNWEFGVNATYLKNRLEDFDIALETGEINGQGLSEVRSQLFANGQPLNVFYLKPYSGIDKTTGVALTDDQKGFAGDPNPDFLLGVSTRANYGKLGLEINMNGAFGHQIYNNTANAILTVNNIGIGRNTTMEAISSGESLASPISASTRYLENASYLKMANATLSYQLGNVKAFRNANLYLTGQNLFVITKYSGFDPEVNTDKTFQDLPSFGIEYTPYPTARTIILGVNFSF